MNEKTLYFSSLCPDTVPFKAAMERLGVTAREVDITASMRNLKEFLRLRDNEAVFTPRKEQGMVGAETIFSKWVTSKKGLLISGRLKE